MWSLLSFKRNHFDGHLFVDFGTVKRGYERFPVPRLAI